MNCRLPGAMKERKKMGEKGRKTARRISQERVFVERRQPTGLVVGVVNDNAHIDVCIKSV